VSLEAKIADIGARQEMFFSQTDKKLHDLFSLWNDKAVPEISGIKQQACSHKTSIRWLTWSVRIMVAAILGLAIKVIIL